MNANDAVIRVAEMETPAEVMAFTEGDDRKTVRFISEDPLGFAGGINFYVYVENNPVNRIDSYGEVDCTYSITGKLLTCSTSDGDVISCSAISGNNAYDDYCKKDIGPIPPGSWTISKPSKHSKEWAILTPDPGNKNETCPEPRTLLRIHGGSKSEGCIAAGSCYEILKTKLECENGGSLWVSQ
jgi:hypothetical protein